MRIAIIILNWNGEVLLERYLPSVVQHSGDADIYVVDNASTDGSIELLKAQFPQVQRIQNKENGGFAKGYNQGLKHVDADIFCLLNSDVEVTEGWLGPIIDTFAKMPEVSILQPKILDLMRKDHFEYAGAGGGFLDELGYPFCRGRIFQALEKDVGQYDDIKEIFWATGACMFIKSALFWELDGFDEDYFAHQEEVDLCWRAKNKGRRVFYVGASQVYHLGGSTLSNMNPKKTYLNFRNSLFSISKNLPRRRALGIIFIRLVLDGVAAIRFILQFKFNHCWAVLRAHLSFYRQFRKMYGKRGKTNYTLKYYLIKSVVWEHFVKGVDKFAQLIKD